MTTRISFQQEIELLNEELAKMCEMIEYAIDRCLQVIKTEDKTMAEDIIKNDRQINDMERGIEARCLSLILRQQPVVAGDLRMVSAALKVVTDLERIGDHAADIAELVLRGGNAGFYREIPDIAEMTEKAGRMVHNAVMAFTQCDVEMAQKNVMADDEVDELFNRVKADVVKHLKNDTGHADDCIDVLMIAKYLERIGDHAVNICEWTEFHETGEVNRVRLV